MSYTTHYGHPATGDRQEVTFHADGKASFVECQKAAMAVVDEAVEKLA